VETISRCTLFITTTVQQFANRLVEPEEVTADSLKLTEHLQQKRLSRTDYLALQPKEDNVVYEIIRDEYLKGM